MSALVMQMNQWLGSLGALVGVSVQLDETGGAEIELVAGGSVSIEVDEANAIVLLYADISSPSATDQAVVFAQAMRLNHLGRGTGGATLGWDAQRDMLVLSAVWPAAALDEDGFLSMLSGFIDVAQRLHGGLEEPDDPEAATDDWVQATQLRG